MLKPENRGSSATQGWDLAPDPSLLSPFSPITFLQDYFILKKQKDMILYLCATLEVHCTSEEPPESQGIRMVVTENHSNECPCVTAECPMKTALWLGPSCVPILQMRGPKPLTLPDHQD